MELISKRNGYNEYVNDFTRELDKYTEGSIIDMFCNYIYREPIRGTYVFRYPGATRGNITVDENMIITGIRIYEDSMELYKNHPKDIFDKYIGLKLVFEE